MKMRLEPQSTKTPYRYAMAPVQTYVCALLGVETPIRAMLSSVLCTTSLKTEVLSINFLRYLRIQLFCDIQFLPISKHTLSVSEILLKVADGLSFQSPRCS